MTCSAGWAATTHSTARAATTSSAAGRAATSSTAATATTRSPAGPATTSSRATAGATRSTAGPGTTSSSRGTVTPTASTAAQAKTTRGSTRVSTASGTSSGSVSCAASDADEDLVQWLALDVRHFRILGRVADRDQDEGSLVFRAIEDLAQETHRARRGREGAETGRLERGQQEPDRDPDRFAHVVVLELRTVLTGPPGLLEHDDHVGRVGDVGLDPVGADRPDRLLPLRGGAPVVEVALFRLRALPQPLLRLGIGDDHERPRLLVRAGGRRARGADRVLDQLRRNGLDRELADGAARLHQLQELARVLERALCGRPVVRERDGTILGHARSIWTSESSAEPRSRLGGVAADFGIGPGDAEEADAEDAGDPPEPDPAVGRVPATEVREDQRAEDPADQAADVPADRDPRDREAEDQVDQDEAERRAAEHVAALPLHDDGDAEDPEQRTGGADRWRKRREDERAGRARESRDQVNEQEAAAADRVLDRRADEPEEVHVERDVEDVRVQEGARDQPPPVAVRDRRPVENPLGEELAAGRVDAGALRRRDHVDHDVDRDQALGDQRPGALEGGATNA